MKIGMRTIKTGIAVSLSLVVSNLLQLEYPLFAAIAAIITMETTVFNSLQAGKNRVLGTLIGGAVGLVAALLYPGNALLSGVGIIIVIYICNLLNWKKSVSIAGVVFMAIMVSVNDKPPWDYAFNRILDTLIGIVIAVLVNVLIVPPNQVRTLTTKLLSLLEQCTDILEQGIYTADRIDLQQLEWDLVHLQEELTAQEDQFGLDQDDVIQTHVVETAVQLYGEIVHHLTILDGICTESHVETLTLYSSDHDEDDPCQCEPCLADDMQTVVDYHSEQIEQRVQVLRLLVTYLRQGQDVPAEEGQG